MLRKSTPIFQSVAGPNIDANNGIIRNIVIVNEGLDKTGDNIDIVFLSQIAQYGNEQLQGVKCRFGHPNLCDDALGTYIGRYKNFRLNGKSVLADLYLDPIAKSSPKGNLFDYILQLAQKNDDMFGNSIVFPADDSEEREVEENGELVSKYFIRAQSLIASDLVDSPAATNSLFKSTDDFAARTTAFLDENPEVLELIYERPEVLKNFLLKYSTYKSMKTKTSKPADGLLAQVLKSFSELRTILSGDKTKSISLVTTDGTTLLVDDPDGDGIPAIGDKVTVNGVAVDDGDYTTEDGTTLTCVGGVITDVKPNAEGDDAGDDTVPVAKAIKENKKLKQDVAEQRAVIEAYETQLKNINEELTKLKSQVTSNYKPGRRTEVKPPLPGEQRNRIKDANRRREAITKK